MSNQESIMRECVVCKHVNPLTYCHECNDCGWILCLACLDYEDFKCPNCGENFGFK